MPRVASNFLVTPAAGARMTCKDAMKKLLKAKRAWEVRSAGKGSKGERWYAWAWLGTASPRHSLLVRRHLKTGELAFCYCYIPDGQFASKAQLIRAAGLRWPAEESFELGKDCFGLDQCQARLYTAILRHAVLVMAALAICAVTAAQWVARLAEAHHAGRLQAELTRLGRYPLLVIDEVGYIPFEAEAANLFFQLVSSRYERASLIVTSNKPFGRWGEVFGDDVVAAAMIDRLVHYAEVISLKGDSYRLKDRDLGRVPHQPAED